MESKSEADKEAVKKISKYASNEIVRQTKEKMKELGMSLYISEYKNK